MNYDYDLKKERKEHFAKIEEYIRLRIKSKPIWMPRFLWYWFLRRILTLDFWK